MKLFNSMSRKKEEFVPITPGEVKMYCCGPTVYNYIHVGNARPMILFDVLRRYLEYRGYKVTIVQNFTAEDDKIIKRANEEHATSQEISEKYIEEYFKDAHGLGVRDATVHPKATENIQQIIDLVQTLIDKGYAYPVNGDVYYRTKKFEGYGKLSHQPIEDLQAGARIDVNDVKEDPLDFALWKAAKPGEPYWDSPWGQGRPGWHIECSAMARKHLGKTIDLHCGGQDLIFPHHENEIAQSACANGCAFSMGLALMGFRAKNAVDAARLSGFAQSVGYALAATGPLVVGWLHDLTPNWNIGLGYILFTCMVALLAGQKAGRDETI